MSVENPSRERAIASIAEAIDPKMVADTLMAAMDEKHSRGGDRDARGTFSFTVNNPATRKLMQELGKDELQRHLMTALHKFLTDDVNTVIHLQMRPRWVFPLRFAVFATREPYYILKALRNTTE